MRKIIYLNQLGEKFVKVAMENHKDILVENGMYSYDEMITCLNDLVGSKIVDLQDSLSSDVYKLLVAEKNRLEKLQ